jgi:hypothetical protein
VNRRRQTSVVVSPRAMATLEAIAAGWGKSRDGAVRELLADYIVFQGARREDDRLTHISTVLRFPPRVVPGQQDRRVRLPLRLDPGVDEQVVELAFRLPGQARRQAHRDYAARPLSDAVVTAIALHTPFVEEELAGLPPLFALVRGERLVATGSRRDQDAGREGAAA